MDCDNNGMHWAGNNMGEWNAYTEQGKAREWVSMILHRERERILGRKGSNG